MQVDGPGTVHLTGNILEDDDDDFMDPEMMMGEEAESDEVSNVRRIRGRVLMINYHVLRLINNWFIENYNIDVAN